MNIGTTNMRRWIAAAAVAAALCEPAGAANWLALQGTEPEGAAARARLWGFIQPQFQAKDDNKLPLGAWKGQNAVFNQIGPQLENANQFQLRRARLGVRGTGFPLDSNVNYFFLVEAGQNGLTEFAGSGSVALTDASVTLNHFKKFTRIRFGQFKHPGSEDGLQAIHVHNYIDFATPTNQLLLERFFAGDGSDTSAKPTNASANANRPIGFSAFRDIGVQLFNFFEYGDWFGYPWEHSYAFMVGNGNGINTGDRNDDKDIYLYASTGPIFKGKGARREDLKLFAWYQDGKRRLNLVSQGIEGDFDRTRWGLGLTFRKDKYRFYAEYYDADGMIFNGTDGGAVPGSVQNDGLGVASFNVAVDEKAWGYYLDGGYKVLPNVELDYRFSYLDRATETAAQERKFWDHTLGVQYFFNKKSRALLNYQIRDAEAPANANADKIVSEIGNVLSLQVLVIF